MIPISDLRQVHVKAVLAGEPDSQSYLPPAPFAAWDQYALALVEGEESGSASAEAYQNSLFFPSGIFAAGSTTGQFQVLPGSYEALSLSTLVFRVDHCLEYSLNASVQTGDLYSQGEITLGVPIGAPDILRVESGDHTLTGRLSPGEYFVEGRSSVATSGPSMVGLTYSIIWTCSECLNPLIQTQPSSLIVPGGSTAVFTVTTTPTAPNSAGPAALTYQWRKNRVPLSDDGHIAGSNTPSLSVFNSSDADTGWYDVVVAAGAVEEPSAYARLTIGSSVGVEPGGPGSSTWLKVEAAFPNPSRSGRATTFRYTAPEPLQADAAVYDAAGHLVQGLGSRLLSGTGVLSWDGRSGSGAMAPPGVYFLRVHADGGVILRRFVRVR